MKNNIKLLGDIDQPAFLREMQLHLTNNLNEYLMNSLSKMLAIDYTNRVKKKLEIDKTHYITQCVARLKNYLKHRVVIEEDFSSTMSLFVIALTEEKKVDDTTNSKEQEQDLLIDGVIAAHFNDLSPAEQQNVKNILKTLIARPDSKEIMNLINSDPKLFYSVVFSAYKEKIQQKDVMESITNHLATIMKQTKALDKTVNNVKSLAVKITLAACLFAAASTGLLIGGLALPALLIPAAAISIRLAPVIGDKIGKSLIKNNKTFQKKQTNLKDMIVSIVSPVSKKKDTILLQPEVEIKAPLTGIKRLENTKELEKENIRKR